MTIRTVQNFLYYIGIRNFCEFIMTLNINKYRKYVDDFDLPEDKKVELLQTVWSIMESFVDKAFGLHPVQQCREYTLEKDLQGPIKALKSEKSQNYLENK